MVKIVENGITSWTKITFGNILLETWWIFFLSVSIKRILDALMIIVIVNELVYFVLCFKLS
jgi:hypothetical protein